MMIMMLMMKIIPTCCIEYFITFLAKVILSMFFLLTRHMCYVIIFK